MSCFDGYRLRTRPMSAQDVLDVLVHTSVLFAEADLGGPLPEPKLDMTLAEWAWKYELSGWPLLKDAINHAFENVLPAGELRELLRDWKKTTMRSVCERIAAHAQAPVAEPITVFGDTSLSAGVFLAVRSLFAQSGADVSDLRPSSALSPYLSAHWQKVLPALIRLAPGRLPGVYHQTPVGVTSAWLFLASQAMFWIGKLIG